MPTVMDKVNLYFSADGTPLEENIYPEAASQVFKKGDFVYLVTGAVTVGAAIGANAGAIKMLGIALKDATGTTGSPIPVVVGTENLRFVLPIAGAAGATQNASNGDMGTAYEIHRTDYGKWCIDHSSTTNNMIIAVEQHPQYGGVMAGGYPWSGVGSTEAYGWYVCKPFLANWAMTLTS